MPVVESILKTEGFQSSDELTYKLIALAVQDFIHNALNNVLDVIPTKSLPSLTGRSREHKLVLGIQDLTGALDSMGVKVQKPHYFADNLRGNQ